MRILIIIPALLTMLWGTAQVPEIGILGGGSYYIGDLNPYKHFYNTKLGGGLFYRNQIKGSDRLNYRIFMNGGTVTAFDSESSDPNLVNRNLNFKSTIFEVGAALEIHFLPFEIGSDKRPGTPYLFMGMSYFKMNPMGSYNDNWVELQSLGTEGQGSSLTDENFYKLNQIALPIGVGVKVNLNERWAFGLEYGIRKTFTDYLDDVSGAYVNPRLLAETNGTLAAEMSDQSLDGQGSYSSNGGVNRGNPNNKDWFSFFGATLSFRVFEYTTCPRKR